MIPAMFGHVTAVTMGITIASGGDHPPAYSIRMQRLNSRPMSCERLDDPMTVANLNHPFYARSQHHLVPFGRGMATISY
jgi:hypothetical protein